MPASGAFSPLILTTLPRSVKTIQGACASVRGRYTPTVTEDIVTETSQESTLYFFPDAEVTESELQEDLQGDDRERRAWAISHLLRFALWEDIWLYVSREEVREIFAELEMPESLQAAWARMLKIEAPVA